jgi:hypothetical protein
MTPSPPLKSGHDPGQSAFHLLGQDTPCGIAEANPNHGRAAAQCSQGDEIGVLANERRVEVDRLAPDLSVRGLQQVEVRDVPCLVARLDELLG